MTNRRVSLSDRLRQDQPEPASSAGRGAEAFLPPDAAVPAQSSINASAVVAIEAARQASSSRTDDTWDSSHKRVTFYCPLDLVGELEQATRATGRSKSQLLVDGLRLALRDAAKGRR